LPLSGPTPVAIPLREAVAKGATLQQVFDLTSARKLDKDGFFKAVFKR
jgi:hypothetical protein